MKRDTKQLGQHVYDILVIGGGIYGACIAWDAALRGLSVALIERADFGHATSANSLKILHGGLRYLQNGNLPLVRMMIRERRAFTRIASNLIRPLPCIMPTNSQLKRSKAVMGAALLLNDMLAFDRNHLLNDEHKQLPRSEILSRRETLRRVPAMVDTDLTGGAVWYDAQIVDTERFTLSFLLSAAELGASVANYMEAIEVMVQDAEVKGVIARDRLADEEFEIAARVVVNATGPWLQQVLGLLGQAAPELHHCPSLAMNLVTRQILPDYALAIPSRGQNGSGQANDDQQTLFIVPWRQYSLVGTKHFTFDGRVTDYKLSKNLALRFLDEINDAYPGADLSADDVLLIHSGFLPDKRDDGSNKVELVRQSRVVDHQATDGLEGLISVVGVKYTTARAAAEQAVDLVYQKLGQPIVPSKTDRIPVLSLAMNTSDLTGKNTGGLRSVVNKETARHLAGSYNSAPKEFSANSEMLDDWSEPVCSGSEIIKAQVIQAVRDEMANKLADVLLRRTQLGAAGKPSDECILSCGLIMAGELGWDQKRLAEELDDVEAYFAERTLS